MVSFNMRSMSVILGIATTLGACEKDPYDPKTWIEKLDESTELETAIKKLDELHCPEAIKPLGKVWQKHNKWSKVLKLMIRLADQPELVAGYTVKGEAKFPDPDCPEAGEGPYWGDAIPFLIEAVQDFDVTSIREIEDAALAAEALGKAKSPDAIQTLISAATKKEKLRQGQLIRIAAVNALGKYGNQPRTVETIIKVLEIEPSKDTIYMNKAAAQALGDTRSPSAVAPLLKALYTIPPIYPQIRYSLTNLGKPAATALHQVFKGNNEAINALAAEHKFATDCDKGVGLESTCVAPGNVRFKAASILGDMRVKEAIPDLVRALTEPAQASFYVYNPATDAGDKPGPSDHSAILNTLRVMGALEAAEGISRYMQASSTADEDRPLAVDVYSMLATDSSALPWLAATMADTPGNKANTRLQPLRDASALAYARLVTNSTELVVLDKKIAENLAAATKSSVAKNKKELEFPAAEERAIAVLFEQHRTRARVGILCKQNLACYSEFLSLDAEAIVSKLKIPNHSDPQKTMDTSEMEAYRIAALERALIEIAKLGKAGDVALPLLLAIAGSSERIVRQGVLLALSQVAPHPCDACATRLQEVLTSQASQTTLANLNSDTRIVLNYFINAGAKLSSNSAATGLE